MKAVDKCSLYILYVDKISCAVQNIREKTSQSLSNKQRLTESEFQFKAFIFRARFFQNYYELAPTLNTKVIARSFLYKFYVHIISCVVQKSSASFSWISTKIRTRKLSLWFQNFAPKFRPRLIQIGFESVKTFYTNFVAHISFYKFSFDKIFRTVQYLRDISV